MTPRTLVDTLLGFLRPSADYRGLRGVGQRWERLAAKRLESEGYEILDRNFRGRAGEVDFVAREADVLCFIEVKGRSGTGFGMPEESVTLEKRRRIFRAAEEYLLRRRVAQGPRRFDVVSILEKGGAAEVTILRGAFDEPPPRRPS